MLDKNLKNWVVDTTAGYCGADIKALCAESALLSLRRIYPHIYTSSVKLDIDVTQLSITRGDFAAAMSKIVPASRRSNACSPAKPMDAMHFELLRNCYSFAADKLYSVFPPAESAARRKIKLLLKQGGGSGDSVSETSKWPDVTDDCDCWMSSIISAEVPVGGGTNDSSVASNNSSLTWNILTCKPRLLLVGADGGSG